MPDGLDYHCLDVFGYEIQLTPQMLSYYNAVANDGELVRPLFAGCSKGRSDRKVI